MDNKSPPFNRPIVLSPPPLHDENLALYLQSHAHRQLSVGYNLQHEFETLNADLDLDLKAPSATQQNSSGSVNHLQPNLAPQSMALGGPLAQNLGPQSLQSSHSIGHSHLVPTTSPSVSGPLPQKPFNFIANQAGLGGGSLNGTGPLLLGALPLLLLLINHSFYGNNLPTRPQTVNDFNLQPSNFYSELVRFTNWIETLNHADSLSMMDYMCQNLPLDILMTFKAKFDQHLAFLQPLQLLLHLQHPFQPFHEEMDHLTLDDGLQQPKPRLFSNYQQFQRSRPKSAEPKAYYNYLDRAKSPTNAMYEKTNFLQLAAALSPGLVAQSPGLQAQEESFDMSQKLGALATINNRVALDSGKKHHHDPTNRNVNSSSVPLSKKPSSKKMSPHKVVQTPSQQQNQNQNQQHQNQHQQHQNQNQQNQNQHSSTPVQSPSQSNTSMPAEVTSTELLENIPAWLKLLRLHKYTESLKDIPWQELIELSDEQLEAKGVKALGARRKLLKAFDVIKTRGVDN